MLRHPRCRLVFMLITLGLAIGASPIKEQTLSFFRHAPEIDQYTAVAADASGIYAFWNAGVRKYDSRGNELWTREFSAPAGGIISAAADATGISMAGYGDIAQLFVCKYSAGGNELWTRQLEFSAPGWCGCGCDWRLCGRERLPPERHLFAQVQSRRRRVVDASMGGSQ